MSARDVLAHIDRINRALQHYREPIEVAPFLAWCDEREARIRRDLDALPALAERFNDDATQRLVYDLGWDEINGMRRLHRWRHEQSGLVERAIVEDALWHADVRFEDIYPDEDAAPAVRERPQQLIHPRRMTDQQIIAAHTVYTRARLTTTEVAELIWRRYGYADADSCRLALQRAWRAMGLPMRRCAAISAGGQRCNRAPLRGSDKCVAHARALTWEIPRDLLDEARTAHLDGASLAYISRQLLHRTPWTSPDSFARRLAEAAQAEGWHQHFKGGAAFHRARERTREAA